jgi:phytoene dehydrogenase-like protein
VKVVVMGAGLAGVTTAWYLAKDGHEVVVIDREPEVAAAASYANGGIIAASRAFPWSGGEIGRALRRSTLRFDPELWLWGIQHVFLRTGGSYQRVFDAKVRLVRYSQQVLHALAGDIAFNALKSGVLYLTKLGNAPRRCGNSASPSSGSSRRRYGKSNRPSMPRASPALSSPRAMKRATRRSFAGPSPRNAGRWESTSTSRTRLSPSSRSMCASARW